MAPSTARGGGGRARGRGARGSSDGPVHPPLSKRAKTQPEVAPSAASEGATHINVAYIADVVANMQTILDAMPGISSQNPLPEECDGFLAPYNPDIYSKKWAEACDTGNLHYKCGINFFWQNCVGSPLPGAPNVQAADRITCLPSHARSLEVPLYHPWQME